MAAIRNAQYPATVVTGIGTVPAISGAHSLPIYGGESVTFHLKRMAAEQSVHFSLRNFVSMTGYVQQWSMIVGTIGNQPATSPSAFTGSADPWVGTGDAVLAYASAIQEVTQPIDDSGTDVLVQITVPACLPFVGYCASSSALMIDDLRLE